MKKILFLVTSILLLNVGCGDDDYVSPPLPDDFEEDVEDGDGGDTDPEIINLVTNGDFEASEDLSVMLETEPLLYDDWSVYNKFINSFTFTVGFNAEQGNVGQMCNTDKSIPNSDPCRAFIAQRIKGVVDPALYTISFKAKALEGSAVCRVFVQATNEDGQLATRYFIYDTGKPTTETGKYWAYCKICPADGSPLPKDEWLEFSAVIDFSKIITKAASVTYGEAVKSTLADRTDIIICLQNNALNSTLQIDDVSLTKYVNK